MFSYVTSEAFKRPKRSQLLTTLHLFVLDLQGCQAGLELREAEGELGLELRLGGNLGHLTGSGTRSEPSEHHCPEKAQV